MRITQEGILKKDRHEVVGMSVCYCLDYINWFGKTNHLVWEDKVVGAVIPCAWVLHCIGKEIMQACIH